MIEPNVLSVEPWAVTEPELRLDLQGETEAIFALSNGHIGLRGNLDEGEPHGVPGTYLNGFYETLPLPYVEHGYGYPEEGQSLIDVINGKLLRLLVDDEPFDVRHGTLRHHRRTLDLRDGVLRREVEWVSPAGRAVRIRSTRLVSFVQRAIAAIRYEVEAIDEPVRIVLQSTLMANEPVPQPGRDPRAATVLHAPLAGEYHSHDGTSASLGHRTRRSQLRMAAGIEHTVEGPTGMLTEAESWPDLARITVSGDLAPGERLTVVKFIGYGWSSVRSTPALRDQVDAALSAAKRTGWEELLNGQREYLSDVWERGDVQVDGDPELQQSVRFSLFQVVQAGARAEQRAMPAKGLTGRGYDGHTFWDMETYTLPVLTYTAPDAVRDTLKWRHSTIGFARERAHELGLKGAAFPWRTINGRECSGYWPAGTAAFHVNADIADAVRRYVFATEDHEFERGAGAELLIETARLWASLGHHDAEGCFRIDGVTGPDEYSALADNNTFTNLMAARNLRAASLVARRYPDRATELGVTAEEMAAWDEAAAAIVVPFDKKLGVTAQSEGFTRYRKWDFEGTSAEFYPLMKHYPYYLLYSSQVVKQADLVLALYLCGDDFSAEQKRRDFDYYESITVRDSSLSAPIQAIVAAEVGHLDLAYDHFREASLIDLRNLAGNTSDGLHLASLSGVYLAAVAGFGGLRDSGEVLSFVPRLPSALSRLAFRLVFRGRRLAVSIAHNEATYELLSGEDIDLLHYGEPIRLSEGSPVSRAVPPKQETTHPQPPPGRAPLTDGPQGSARSFRSKSNPS